MHIDETAVHDQFQTDIPKVKPFTRCFHVHVGACVDCGGRVQGRHDLQTSDAIGAAAVQIGPNALALAVKRTLQDALALRDRRDQMSSHGFAVARGRITTRMDRLLAGNITYEPNARLKRHLERERDALFTFLDHPEIEATTWLAEQEIRPNVVNRKTSGGSRSDRGAEAQAILPSIIRTARRQQREPVKLMIGLLRARDPTDLGLARGPRGRTRIARQPHAEPRALPAA